MMTYDTDAAARAERAEMGAAGVASYEAEQARRRDADPLARLDAAQAEHHAARYAEGREHGRQWATDEADWDALEVVADAPDQPGLIQLAVEDFGIYDDGDEVRTLVMAEPYWRGFSEGAAAVRAHLVARRAAMDATGLMEALWLLAHAVDEDVCEAEDGLQAFAPDPDDDWQDHGHTLMIRFGIAMYEAGLRDAAPGTERAC